ncbi:leucyl aminopeptidase [Arcanobacterium pinnipediorum]|uniref:Probable cytosol aminopeptidase n=1 Tax=Arcanobacterium pinnipediorum TaxID=1503041 RepID=A0ABY5AJR4_9ACTO|nr:leucyl aminopeptidase [Arcanobacterium pinnipediorum]USR80097.1 leucyl aminopeptidase [Arcanobacterium pinnipediorum]
MTTYHFISDLDLHNNIVVAVTKKDDAILVVSPVEEGFAQRITQALTTLDFSAKPLSTLAIVNPADETKIVIAVGLCTEHETESLRHMAGAALRASAGREAITICLPHTSAAQAGAIVEGAHLGGYVFDAYKKPAKARVTRVEVVSDFGSSQVLDRALILSEAVNAVRDLENTTPNYLNPVTFAQEAEKVAREAGLSVTVFDEQALEAEKLNGLLQVGRGSASAPRLVRVEYNPSDAHGFTALVGKGITFDTGGYSLKPSTAITEMKTDMTGAATVLYAAIAAAKLGVKRKVVAWLCLAENMVSGSAGRPDDVIVYRNGLSVEINNTDAEGRLVMADGLIMSCEENPDEIIDIATLTGAQMVALGNRTTGIMGSDDVRSSVVAAADRAGEPAWAMPLPQELRSSLDSDCADMKNSGSRFGGMLVAGLFLKEFVGDTPWAHIDIAGPSFNRESEWGYQPKGATGVMLRTLVEHINR